MHKRVGRDGANSAASYFSARTRTTPINNFFTSSSASPSHWIYNLSFLVGLPIARRAKIMSTDLDARQNYFVARYDAAKHVIASYERVFYA
jgi:hypothetical protein